MNTKTMMLALLMAGTTTIATAQVKFGAKVGLNVSTLNGDFPSSLDTKSKIGFHLGPVAEIPFTGSKFSLLSELLVSTQGLKTENQQDSFEDGVGNVHEEENQDLTVTRINLPVMLRYNVVKNLNVEVGPQFGFAIAAKTKIDYTNSAHPEENANITLDNINGGSFVVNGQAYTYESGINRFEFGVVAGATYDITRAFFMQARYNLGLTDVDKKSTVGSSTTSLGLKSSVFQISTGYRFN